jgi:RNA polymerase sigma-70 factor, ECF subfamily
VTKPAVADRTGQVSAGSTSGQSGRIDDDLVERCQDHDPRALADLLILSRPLVQRTVRRTCPDCPTQEDIVQTVLTDVVAGIDTLRSPRAFVAWVLGITRNVCRKEISGRSRARHRLQPLDSVEGRVPSRYVGPEEAAVRVELHGAVAEAFDSLPARQRSALLMRLVDGRSYEEIGDQFGVSPELARVWAFRARHRLQRDLRDTVPAPSHPRAAVATA